LNVEEQLKKDEGEGNADNDNQDKINLPAVIGDVLAESP